MTAQKLSDDIKANAELEARRIIREAEGRSDLLLEKTQARLEDIQREIDGLKLKRKDVETSIEATIPTLRNTLEFVREQEARERDDKILLHRPRHASTAERDRTTSPSSASRPARRRRVIDARRPRHPAGPQDRMRRVQGRRARRARRGAAGRRRRQRRARSRSSPPPSHVPAARSASSAAIAAARSASPSTASPANRFARCRQRRGRPSASPTIGACSPTS